MNNLGLGLELMLVGMASVFVILLVVILLGKLTIIVTNLFPEKSQAEKPASGTPSVNDETRSVIEAAVRELTGGKGIVKEIEKL